jgi:hypothetical protein
MVRMLLVTCVELCVVMYHRNQLMFNIKYYVFYTVIKHNHIFFSSETHHVFNTMHLSSHLPLLQNIVFKEWRVRNLDTFFKT